MNTPERPNDSTAPRKDSSGAWLQGILLGVLIGIAFAGGWILSRNADDGDSRASDDSAGKAPPQVIYMPSAPAPQPPVTPPPAAPVAVPAPETPAPVAAPETKPAPAAPAPAAPAPAAPAPAATTPASDEIFSDNAGDISSVFKKSAPPKLAISTEPDTNVLLINGRDLRALGKTDAKGQLFVEENLPPAGESVSLIFRHPKCVSERRNNVDLIAGETTRIVMPLRWLPGSLTIAAEPADAEVWLDGVMVGRGVVMIGDVAANTPHAVEVRLRGQEPLKRSIVVEPDSPRFERIAFQQAKPETGDILLMGAARTLASQPGAIVKVDGSAVKVDQGLIRGVKAGERKVTILKGATADGSASTIIWERAVQIEAGSATSLLDAPAPAVAATGAGVDPALTATLPAAVPADDENANIALTLLDAKRRVITADKIVVTFNGKALEPAQDGTWPVPRGVSGIFRVAVSGYEADERPLLIENAGKYVIICPLKQETPASVAAAAEKALPPPITVTPWVARVLSISEDDGIMALSIPEGVVVRAGQDIRFLANNAERSMALRVFDSNQGWVTCQILPASRSFSLPRHGEEGTVTTESRGQ